ncbi:mid region of cactin [Arabidopsis thaliana]|uniref:Mid region of cactin n=1 Tax=Arabidopsis thaliana TaxID=3702 RepID=F4IP14_ARATH|nr:mid region of cactin [Arabidopsis thaliana]AEC09301.1 mid region of cactin [Arabidopsis thaliana]|eukprot:NP_001154558.1 mid region of cactin [Arabidopsis thaliana]
MNFHGKSKRDRHGRRKKQRDEIEIREWELTKARRRDEELLASQERALHAGVEAGVRELLDGKTHAELVQLQFDIESQLRSGAAKVVEYREAVLKRLNRYKAKACLKK